jgi:hypothetical protein
MASVLGGVRQPERHRGYGIAPAASGERGGVRRLPERCRRAITSPPARWERVACSIVAQTIDFLPCETDPACLTAITTPPAPWWWSSGNGDPTGCLQEPAGRYTLHRGKVRVHRLGCHHSRSRARRSAIAQRGGNPEPGSRIDCFAWGEDVAPQQPGTTDLTAAISARLPAPGDIAGVALCVQGPFRRHRRVSPPNALRALLGPSDQSAPPTDWSEDSA